MVLAWIAALPATGAAQERPYRRFLRVSCCPSLRPRDAPGLPGRRQPNRDRRSAASSLSGAADSRRFASVSLRSVERGEVALRRRSASAPSSGSSTSRNCGRVRARLGRAAGLVERRRLPRPARDVCLPVPSSSMLPDAGSRNLCRVSSTYCTATTARTFIGYPSLNSLYLWSGIESPPPTAPAPGSSRLTASDSSAVVDEMRASPRPCAIRSDTRAELWLHGEPPPQRPLVQLHLQ